MPIIKNLNMFEYFNYLVKLKKPYMSKILYEQTISQVFILTLYFIRIVALSFFELQCIVQVLNMRNIFLKNSTQNVVKKLVPDPFLKIKIGHQQSKILQIFHKVYSINRPNFIVSLPLLLDILRNMCTVIVCLPGCDVINF